MKMKKFWKPTIAIMMLLLLMVGVCIGGCGNKDENTTKKPDNSGPSAEAYTESTEVPTASAHIETTPEPTDKPSISEVTGTGKTIPKKCPIYLTEDFEPTYDWLVANDSGDWEYAIGYNGSDDKTVPEYLDEIKKHEFTIGKGSDYGTLVEMETTDGNPLKDKGLSNIYVYDGTNTEGGINPEDAYKANYLFYRSFYDDGVLKSVGMPEDVSDGMQWLYDNWGEPTRVEDVTVGYAWIYCYENCTVAISYNTLWDKIMYIDAMNSGLEDAWIEANN